MTESYTSFQGIELTSNDENTIVRVVATDQDPRLSGLGAPKGSMALSTTGDSFLKFGTGDTDWLKVNNQTKDKQYLRFDQIGTTSYSSWLSNLGKDSGSSNGFRYNSCLPHQVLSNSKIVKAHLTLKGAAIAGSKPDSAVDISFTLYRVGFNSVSVVPISVINFPINGSQIGNWYNSSASSDIKTSIELDLPISEGELLGLAFNSSSSSSKAVSIRDGILTLTLESS